MSVFIFTKFDTKLLLICSNKNSNVWRSNSESDLKEMFTKKAKSKHCDSSFSMTGGRQRLNGKQSGGRLQRTGEDKENHSALKNHFQISHRRRSWPPKEAACNEAASGYHFFFNNNHGDKKNGQRRPHHFTSSGFYLGDDSDMENLFSEINKSQSIRSRVKERIEGFEKFKVCWRVYRLLNLSSLTIILFSLFPFNSRRIRVSQRRTLPTTDWCPIWRISLSPRTRRRQ